MQLKYPVYQEWVKDLIEQNKNLIESLDELEKEACNRLTLLESKLQKDILNFGTENRYQQIENDIKNLLEIIHRAQNQKKWCTNGLTFNTLTLEDIFGERP